MHGSIWRADMGEALQGLTKIDCAHVQEEADVIALLLRETLEEPGKTAALITHDRSLAGRVIAIMHRFGVTVDDSAGLPLNQMPGAAFFRLILEVAISNFAPVALLGLLKHPLTHAGLERIVCLEAARELEKDSLRGMIHASGLVIADNKTSDEVRALLANLQRIFAPLRQLLEDEETHSVSELVEAHMACAEALAGDELW